MLAKLFVGKCGGERGKGLRLFKCLFIILNIKEFTLLLSGGHQGSVGGRQAALRIEETALSLLSAGGHLILGEIPKNAVLVALILLKVDILGVPIE